MHIITPLGNKEKNIRTAEQEDDVISFLLQLS